MMGVERLASRFETPDWPSEFAKKLDIDAPSKLTSKDCRLLEEHARKDLERGRVGHARNWVALGLYLDPASMVAHCKRVGLFRASKYRFQGKPLQRLLDAILELRRILNLSVEDVRYLESVGSLLALSTGAVRIHRFIARELKRREKVALKSLVACVDLLFLEPRLSNLQLDSDDPSFYTIEEHAGALSLLVHVFATLHGIKDRHFELIDERGIANGTYERLLIAACKLRVYREAELWVDVFSYSTVKKGTVVHLAPSDRRLEQSIRLGYIQNENQKNLAFLEHFQDNVDNAPSLEEMTKQIYAQSGTNLVKLLEKPIPRYALILPEVPKLLKPFRSDGLFKEDIGNLYALAKEQYASSESVLRFQLAEGLTLFDLMKIQRFLNFLRGLMAERLRPLFNTDSNLAIRSLIPAFDIDRLLAVLKLCVSEKAARTFLRLATYNHSRGPGVFDVQYHPVIRGKNRCLLPLNILCSSNLLRNLLYTQRKSVQEKSEDDPMQHLLAEALRIRFPKVAENQELKVNRNKVLELDIVAIINRHLLVIECKRAFHPCGAHELRTSHDHILKAARQLDRIKDALEHEQFRRRLFQRLNWQLGDVDEVSTCVVTGNRLFNGYKIGDHPVRQAYEMINMVAGGTAAHGQEEFRLWRNSDFEAQDLLDYLAGSTMHAEFFNAMEEITFQYELDSATMLVWTYALVPETLEHAVKAKYSTTAMSSVETH